MPCKLNSGGGEGVVWVGVWALGNFSFDELNIFFFGLSSCTLLYDLTVNHLQNTTLERQKQGHSPFLVFCE